MDSSLAVDGSTISVKSAYEGIQIPAMCSTSGPSTSVPTKSLTQSRIRSMSSLPTAGGSSNEREIAVLKEQLKQSQLLLKQEKKQKNKILSDLKSKRDDNENMKQFIQRAKTNLQNEETNFKRLSDQLRQADSNITRLNLELQAANEKVSKERDLRIRVESEFNKLQFDKHGVDHECTVLQGKLMEESKLRMNTEDRLKKASDQIRTMQSRIDHKMGELDMTRQESTKHRDDLTRTKKDNTRLQQTVFQLEDKVGELMDQNRMLSDLLKTAKQQEDQEDHHVHHLKDEVKALRVENSDLRRRLAMANCPKDPDDPDRLATTKIKMLEEELKQAQSRVQALMSSREDQQTLANRGLKQKEKQLLSLRKRNVEVINKLRSTLDSTERDKKQVQEQLLNTQNRLERERKVGVRTAKRLKASEQARVDLERLCQFQQEKMETLEMHVQRLRKENNSLRKRSDSAGGGAELPGLVPSSHHPSSPWNDDVTLPGQVQDKANGGRGGGRVPTLPPAGPAGRRDSVGTTPLSSVPSSLQSSPRPRRAETPQSEYDASDDMGEIMPQPSGGGGVESVVESDAEKDLPPPGSGFIGDDMMIEAALEGDVNTVKVCLASGSNINARGSQHMTALYAAARRGNHAVVQELLERGAHASGADAVGATALHMAAKNGDIVCLRMLLDAGGNPMAADKHGITPTHVAAIKCHTECVRELVTASSQWSQTKKQDGQRRRGPGVQSGGAVRFPALKMADVRGNTVLHVAAERGHTATVRTLLALGADPTIRNCDGHTPLDRANARQHISCSNLLAARMPRKVTKRPRSGIPYKNVLAPVSTVAPSNKSSYALASRRLTEAMKRSRSAEGHLSDGQGRSVSRGRSRGNTRQRQVAVAPPLPPRPHSTLA
eukprot:Rmarinus@m.28788